MVLKFLSRAKAEFYKGRKRDCQCRCLAIEKDESSLTLTLGSGKYKSVTTHLLPWIRQGAGEQAEWIALTQLRAGEPYGSILVPRQLHG
jgi:hypothetical protein